MCSERDCSIFRGMIAACDGCAKYAGNNQRAQETTNQLVKASPARP